MERLLALVATLFLAACLASGLLAIEAWTDARDLWGLFYAALSLSAGATAQRLVDPHAGGNL